MEFYMNFHRWMVVVVASSLASRAIAQTGSLADAYKIVSVKQFVDLTHSFGPLTPVWKGFGPATFSAAADPATGRPYTIPQDGFRSFFYSMVGQYGTHIDPPAHIDPKGNTVDEPPLKHNMLPMTNTTNTAAHRLRSSGMTLLNKSTPSP